MEDMLSNNGLKSMSNAYPGGVSGWNIPMQDTDEDEHEDEE
jgi:hypothetical protein